MTELPAHQLPPKSHNNPPNELEILQENLTLRYVSLMRDAEARIALSAKIPEVFTAQNEADFVSDYIAEIGQLQKSLESARKDEKEPFLRQGQAVDEFFNSYRDNLTESADKAKIPLTNWLKKVAVEEQARRDAEAAKLRAEEEKARNLAAVAPSVENMEKAVEAHNSVVVADKVAAAPVVSMAAATGKYSKSSLKKEWVGTIADITKVDLEKLRAYIKPEAIQVALNAYVKMGGRACDGCLIEETVKVGVK